MSDPLTDAELAAMRARVEAADSTDEWSRGRVGLRWTPEESGRAAALWYDDGDQCAAVHGDLGLGMEADAWAEFFAHARQDVPRLLADLDRLRADNAALRRQVAALAERCHGQSEALARRAGRSSVVSDPDAAREP